jgi:hypothetical protein
LKNFADKIRSLITPRKDSVPANTPFDFVKTKKGILRELVMSKESNSIIGVYCRALGEGMFLTAVEAIEKSLNEEDIINFHQYDMSGKTLARTKIRLNEIEMVCPFHKAFQRQLTGQVNRHKNAAVIA